MEKRKLSIMGSTGSIGTQALKVVEENRGMFEVVSLGARGSNLELLREQINSFKPRVVAISDEKAAERFRNMFGRNTEFKVLEGTDGLIEAATLPNVELVISAITGIAGLMPTYHAIRAGKDIALANKETLVAAGHIIMEEVKKNKVKLIPVDSEHSAIYQCLEPVNKDAVESIILTASGGAFKDYTNEELDKVSPEEALKHPNWDMGKKITVDSATLMNKGLEVIEAHWLFNIDYNKIEVIIHPQSIIHSMVRYIDGSVLAHMGTPDMKVAIQYALTCPKRFSSSIRPLDFVKTGQLTFEEPRWNDFPCLKLAFEVGKKGGNLPAAMNGANEKAVEFFLQGKIKFKEIAYVINHVVERCEIIENPSLNQIFETDYYARKEVSRIVNNGKV